MGNVQRARSRAGAVAEELLHSANVVDRRKANDLQRLCHLETTLWRDRFAINEVAAGPRRELLLILGLDATGLAFESEPVEVRQWQLEMAIAPRYPLSMPNVRFVGRIPYNPHVLHSDFLPSEETLPAALRHFVEEMRAGTGGCCFLDASQWSAATSHDLALVVWQVSRIITGCCTHAETMSLNNHARDLYLRQQGRFPLGPAVPFPGGETATTAQAGDADTPIEWS